MTIAIDRLTEVELIDLNHRIVERLRFLQQARAHKQMLEFRIGDRVAFQADGRGTVEGMLTRYNRKSVTVITDDGHHWNVAPSFLARAAAPVAAKPTDGPNLARLKVAYAVPGRHAVASFLNIQARFPAVNMTDPTASRTAPNEGHGRPSASSPAASSAVASEKPRWPRRHRHRIGEAGKDVSQPGSYTKSH